MIGKMVSHYMITEKLGEGGIGIVYKAEDTRLKRVVALKFLTPEYTRDSEAKKRFLQEAQAISSLQHRNICTIHEIDETREEQVFIAMDFYNGESLRKKINRRPLPLNDVIDFASQIAQGLDTAHRAGIIHRDIKPANILITEQNEVKIIDFGLAKLTDRTKVTHTGTTLGTVAYMSPEQLLGKKVDHRSDIWSLGVVLYQMITGILPFKGEYEQALSYAILNKNPEPITALRTGVPLELERIVMKAMAKDAGRRYQHADELPIDLVALEISDDGVSRISAKRNLPWKKLHTLSGQKVLGMLLTGLILGATLATVLIKLFSTGAEPVLDVMRFNNTPFSHNIGMWSAISADGKHIVYQGVDGVLYRKDINQLEDEPLAEHGYKQFFSPDGRWLCYQAEWMTLYKVSIEGGTPISLFKLPNTLRGGFWSEDNNIIFATVDSLYKVASDGSNLHVIAKSHAGKIRHPSPLPGSKAILCTIWHGKFEEAQIGLLNLETNSLRVIFKSGMAPCYAYSGHIIYTNTEGVIMAAPFDVLDLKVTGKPVPTSITVNQRSLVGDSHYSLSQNGILVYILPNPNRETVVEVDRQGNEKLLISQPGFYRHPQYSPDGKKLVILKQEKGGFNIWIYDIEKGNFSNHLTVDNNLLNPRWAPDGKFILFSTISGTNFDICRISASHTEPVDSIYTAKGFQMLNSISTDEKWIFFTYHTQETNMDIGMFPFGKDFSAKPLIHSPFAEDLAELSPDGRCLAYRSNEMGQPDVYVQSFPDPSELKRKISSNGGSSPVWSRSPDRKELFYNWYKNTHWILYSVKIETEPIFKASEPELLFKKEEYILFDLGRNYDIHPSGKHFVVIKRGKPEPYRMIVVLNWFEELKRLAPVN